MKSKISLIALLLLTSCTDKTSQLKYEDLPAEEVYISHMYNPRYGVVTGSRNVYITYGKTSLNEVGGTALTPLRRFKFRIKDLVAKWPIISSERVRQAIEKQESAINHLRK